MMQGDSYSVPVVIKKSDGSVVTNNDVLDVEIVLGNLRKSLSDGSITYANEKWLFPLTQEETFGFASAVKGQVRIKWKNGDVEGVPLDRTVVNYSRSKEVL